MLLMIPAWVPFQYTLPIVVDESMNLKVYREFGENLISLEELLGGQEEERRVVVVVLFEFVLVGLCSVVDRVSDSWYRF